MKKKTVIRILDTLGNEFNMEELVEKLVFIEGVEKGLQNVSDAKVISIEKSKQKFDAKWNS